MPANTRIRKSEQSGAIFLEAAVMLPIFLFVTFFGIELVRVNYTGTTLQHAVNRAARYATLGYHYPGDDNGATAGVDSVRQKITEISGYTIDRFEMCRAGTASCSSNTRGNQGEWIKIKAETVVPRAFGVGSVRLKATALVKNEPNYELIDEPPASMNVSVNENIGEDLKAY